jgi:hypothetical protein
MLNLNFTVWLATTSPVLLHTIALPEILTGICHKTNEFQMKKTEEN